MNERFIVRVIWIVVGSICAAILISTNPAHAGTAAATEVTE